MAPTPTQDAKAARLLEILKPYLFQLLRDAPDFGEVSITAVIHDGDIGRVKLGAEVARAVAPRADRGQR
jgi:hypothetical protein